VPRRGLYRPRNGLSLAVTLCAGLHRHCLEIAVGFLTPGQSKQTSRLTTVRTCDYHDHSFHALNFNGRIVIR